MQALRRIKDGVSKDALLVFGLIAAGYFYSSLQRVSAAAVLPYMAMQYDFSAALVGFLSSLFFYSYGFLQNVWGAVNDRVGPMRACPIGLAVAGFGSLIMLAGHSPFVIGLSRIVCGLGVGSLFTGIYLYAALAFPAAQYPFWVGCIMMLGNLGSVAAIAPLGIVMDRMGYKGLYLLLALFAFAVAVPLYLSQERLVLKPQKTGGPKRSAGAETDILIADLKHGVQIVATHHPLLVIVIVWAVLSAAIHTLQGLWGATWISSISGVSFAEVRYRATFMSVGLVCGAPAGIYLKTLAKSDKRNMLGIVAAICAAWLAFLTGAWLRVSAPATGWLGFFIGTATGAGMVYCSSTIKSLVDIDRTGLVMGTGNTLIYTLVILFQWGSSFIIDRFPGAAAGTYRNAGFLISFGLITALLLYSLYLVTTVAAFVRKEHASE